MHCTFQDGKIFVSTVDPGTLMTGKLRHGDVITHVNDQGVTDTNAAREVIVHFLQIFGNNLLLKKFSGNSQEHTGHKSRCTDNRARLETGADSTDSRGCAAYPGKEPGLHQASTPSSSCNSARPMWRANRRNTNDRRYSSPADIDKPRHRRTGDSRRGNTTKSVGKKTQIESCIIYKKTNCRNFLGYTSNAKSHFIFHLQDRRRLLWRNLGDRKW